MSSVWVSFYIIESGMKDLEYINIVLGTTLIGESLGLKTNEYNYEEARSKK